MNHRRRCVSGLLAAAIILGAVIIKGGQADRAARPSSGLPAINHDFWSFKKPVEPNLPTARNASWARNEIDHFILAKLEQKGLAPSAEADRRTLIRRATYDLHGLPPTPQEVEAFVADPAPDAYEKLIDRLLASPRYGERWGRYWLDLARYSDTKGYAYAREERQFFHAWNYRDWVIKSLNEDLPYDRFLMLQIAADQLTPADGARLPDDLAAMGFLTVGRRFLGVVPDIVDDRIDVTMRTTMGLTVGCARCHDHKFDPIPTADYYSLYGIFVGSTESSVCLDPSPAQTPEYIKYDKGLKERTDKLNSTFNTRKEELLARLRSKAGDYLANLHTLAKHPDDNFYHMLGVDDLNPVVMRQWENYLLAHGKDFDPIWSPWTALHKVKESELAEKSGAILEPLLKDAAHPLNKRIAGAFESAKPASIADVAKIYGAVLTDVNTRWRDLIKASPETKVFPDADDQALWEVLYGKDTPAHVPHGSIADVEWFFDEPTRVNLDKLQADIERWKVATPGAPRYALILEDRPQQHTARIYKRGNPNTPGDEVTRHFLSLIAGPNPPAFKTGSGRLELARAIASKDNPLTARVMVNRIWQHHFDSAIVATESDFGNRSVPPLHRELLDWLAMRFMKEGWSVKSIHRLIMCSATYRQQSADNPAASAIDPENQYYWRMNRTRLDFEAMRDSLLLASGALDMTAGGRPAEIMGNRRTIYARIDRQFVPGMVRSFDFACPDLHIPQRAATTVPQQALFFMNSPFVIDRARALASRSDVANEKDETSRIERLYEIVYQRKPTPQQTNASLAFIRSQVPAKPEPPPAPIASVWKYGYGEYDPIDDRMSSFTPLPYFTGNAWQGGPRWPDRKLGWVQLTATGGHSGNDIAHAAIRRWTAPRDMTIRITGEVRHEYTAGHGIAARLISSRSGTLGHWTLHNSRAETKVDRLEVKRGETIDFVADFAGFLNSNMFTWSPAIMAIDKGAKPEERWTTTTDFGVTGAPTQVQQPLSPWTVYAQVLLMSNEFMFVD